MNNEEIKKNVEAGKEIEKILGFSEYQSMALYYLSNRYGMDICNLGKQALNEFIKNHCSDVELKRIDQVSQPNFELQGLRGKRP